MEKDGLDLIHPFCVLGYPGIFGVLEHVANTVVAPHEEHDVYLLCAGPPDHGMDVLAEHCREALVGTSNVLHCIAYNCQHSPKAIANLQELAQIGK